MWKGVPPFLESIFFPDHCEVSILSLLALGIFVPGTWKLRHSRNEAVGGMVKLLVFSVSKVKG